MARHNCCRRDKTLRDEELVRTITDGFQAHHALIDPLIEPDPSDETGLNSHFRSTFAPRQNGPITPPGSAGLPKDGSSVKVREHRTSSSVGTNPFIPSQHTGGSVGTNPFLPSQHTGSPAQTNPYRRSRASSAIRSTSVTYTKGISYTPSPKT